jgi:DNA-binding response OmpR family regulator
MNQCIHSQHLGEVGEMARILVIDDEPVVTQTLRRYLERFGFEVFVASNGEEGCEVQKREQADVVVTDILMPGREGFETIRFLREISPGVKIVAISGGGRNEPHTYLRFAQRFGADRAFSKPLDMTVLISSIRELLGEPHPV